MDTSVVTATGAFMALSVADLERSALWYSEKLGLKRVTQASRMGSVAGFVLLEAMGSLWS